MTAAADLILTNAEVHTLADPDETHSAVASRDGDVIAVGDAYDLEFLAGAETDIVDLDGRVVLPGFVDAHTHLAMVGRYERHADLRGAGGLAEVLDRLAAEAETGADPVVGFGFDESEWADPSVPTRSDLASVTADRPVVAVREDMHTAVVNDAALERWRDELPADGVRTVDGEPTGVLVEGALDALWDALAPTRAEARQLLRAARDVAHARGVTAVHDVPARAAVAGAFHDLARSGELQLRARLNYRRASRDDLAAVGLRTNDGGPVRVGGLKAFADGSIGGRTARLAAPYADDAGRGQWVTDPEALRRFATDAAETGFQIAVHAIGDAAVEVTLDAVEGAGGPGRHRIEHAELATDEAIERMAAADVVASVQPNFHKWADDGGLYDRALGTERRKRTNRLRRLYEAGVDLAFGSDCMPLDPLFGVHHAVNAPTPEQHLPVTAALRAYTHGGAYAGFEEDKIGTVEPGKRADLVVVDGSPWERSDEIDDLDVALTVVGGEVVYDDR